MPRGVSISSAIKPSELSTPRAPISPGGVEGALALFERHALFVVLLDLLCHCHGPDLQMPIEAGIDLGQVQQGLAHPLECLVADRALLVPELLQRAAGGEPRQIVERAPHAEGRHIVQQGGEANRAVDGNDPLEQRIKRRQRQVIAIKDPPFQSEQGDQPVYLGLVADVTSVHGVVLEQQHIFAAGMLGKRVHHLCHHLLDTAQIRMLADLEVLGDLQGNEEDMSLVCRQGFQQTAICPAVAPLHQAAGNPAAGLLVKAPGSVIDEVGVAPAKQALVDVVAAGIPGSSGKGLAHLQRRLVGLRPLHLRQLVTLGIERAEGVDPSLLQGHVVGAQVPLFHGPDGNLFLLADANGLQMVITAVTVADQAVDTVALDEAAKKSVPALRFAGKALVMADTGPALIPTVEMDLVHLMAGIAQHLAQGLKEGAQRSLQQQNLHVRLIS